MPAYLVEDAALESELDDKDGLESALIVEDGSKDKTTFMGVDVNSDDVLDGDDVPEKYRGKSARELLDIVKNQESLMGRHSQELGTLRGLVDQSLRLRDTGDVGRPGETAEVPLTEDDFLTNPSDATRRTVRDETAELRDQVASLSAQAEGHQFDAQYPSAAKDINDPKFVDFIKGSTLRHKLATDAFGDSKNLDFEAAGELWALYEDYKTYNVTAPEGDDTIEKKKPEANAEASAAPGQTPKAPVLVSGPTSSSSKVDSPSNKRIYSQAALNRLQERDPDLYWSTDIQKQITEAHQDGRVRQDL